VTDDVWLIETLGWLRISRGPVEHRALSQKAASLLAYLALNKQPSHSREELAALFWPDATGAASRHSLRTRLYELRRVLEPPGTVPGSVLEADRDRVSLNPGAFTTDVAEFSAAAAVAPGAEPGDLVIALQRAVGWYRGELLPGFFDPWILAERRRLSALYADVLEQLLEALCETGATAEAIDVAHRLIACDPLNEEAHVSLMRLYAAQGRSAAALDQYRAFCTVLQDELGVEPSKSAASFADGLRREAAAAAPAIAAPGGTEVRRPAAVSSTRVPAHLTQFVGREEELSRLRALLADGGARLVTIAGPGGIGKTRLAAAVAHEVERESGAGALYLELADVVDERFVADSLAVAVGLGRTSGPDLTEAVAAALSARERPLLVIDNAERVAGAVADSVRRLLDRVPGLRVIVTSRQPLAIQGEVEIRLGPLPVPGQWERPEDLLANPCVAMYVDRARARRADFALTNANAAAVARLCSQLEGIPLALELAAVRERVLPAAQMIARLEKRFDVLVGAQRDVPERHRTLSAAIDWSYRALGPDERRAFGRLSVFRGGWSLEEAEAICASPETADVLERLVEVSLVDAFDRGGVRRFRMLETIREFALERVGVDERDELRRHHARMFLALAERAHVYLNGPEQAVWYERIDAEFDNVRAALDWSLREGDVVTVVRIFVALNRYWPARSRRREARRWLREALERGTDRLPRRLLARGLRYAAELGLAEGDLVEARRYLEDALAIVDATADPLTAGYVLSGLGHIAARHDEFDEARGLLLRGLELATPTGNPDLLACLGNDLGVLEARSRNYERALGHFSESLANYRTIGDDTSVITLLYNLGYLATIVGQFERAESYLAESIETSRRLGHAFGLASSTTFLGLLELRRGRMAEAVERCREAVDLCLEVGETHRLVLAVEGLGLALVDTSPATALMTLAHAAFLREDADLEPVFEDDELTARAISALSSSLGESESQRLLAHGRAASTEQLLAIVRESGQD
jgi:predicted ATPase/DNA-binding SARP family transcriptional activator